MANIIKFLKYSDRFFMINSGGSRWKIALSFHSFDGLFSGLARAEIKDRNQNSLERVVHISAVWWVVTCKKYIMFKYLWKYDAQKISNLFRINLVILTSISLPNLWPHYFIMCANPQSMAKHFPNFRFTFGSQIMCSRSILIGLFGSPVIIYYCYSWVLWTNPIVVDVVLYFDMFNSMNCQN